MKSIRAYLLLTFCLLVITTPLLSQTFTNSRLIDIPGENYDFDIYSEGNYPGALTYLTWVNQSGSVYNIYLKQISPLIEETILVASGDKVLSNPKMAENRNALGIKIAWESRSEDYYRISYRNFLNNSLSDEIILRDSIESSPQISLSIHYIAWIDNGNLYLQGFYNELGKAFLVNTVNCTSPVLSNVDDITNTTILFEKENPDNHFVYYLEFSSSQTQGNTPVLISDSSVNSRNPRFGVNDGVSYEIFDGAAWRIKYTPFYQMDFEYTSNTYSNYRNSSVFSYPVPTCGCGPQFPYFIAFESDSLENNREIFIETFYYGMDHTNINISNMEGDDYSPESIFFQAGDTTYVAVFWNHETTAGSEIWISKSVYGVITSVDENADIPSSFTVRQNYPNPFNPETTIEFFTSSPGKASVKIYDMLGNLVSTLADEYQDAGEHKISFNGENLPSGIYFYTVNSNGVSQTKPMVLLK